MIGNAVAALALQASAPLMPPAHAPPPRGSDDRGLPYGPESVAKDETYLCKISEGGPRQHTLQTRVRLRWSLLPLSAWPAERARGRVRIDALEQEPPSTARRWRR